MAENLNYLCMFMDWWFDDNARLVEFPQLNSYGIHTYLSKYKNCNLYYRTYGENNDIPKIVILGYTPNRSILTDKQKFKLTMLRFKIHCQDNIDLDFNMFENLTNNSITYEHCTQPCAFIQLWKMQDTAYTAENIENILHYLDTQIDIKSYPVFIECEESSLEYKLLTDIGFDIHGEVFNPKTPLIPNVILKFDRRENHVKHHDNHIMTTGG